MSNGFKVHNNTKFVCQKYITHRVLESKEHNIQSSKVGST